MAADRAAYIDQSQSLNIHIEQPTISKISSVHFYGWKKVSIYLIVKKSIILSSFTFSFPTI